MSTISMLFVILIVAIVGASACRQEPPIEFVPVGCHVIDRTIDVCPSKRIICQGGRELRSACLLHKDPGPCHAGITKYFYNPLSKRCEQFQYGGCSGNDNRFDTVGECEAACDAKKLPEVLRYEEYERGVCGQSLNEGISCNSRPSTTNWYYDMLSDRCRSFRFLGCGGNANRFPSKADCERRCISNPNINEQRHDETCQLPSKRGSCFSSHTRWFFDKLIGECVTFDYSGCDGNENNFESKEECEQACGETLRCPYSRNSIYPVIEGCRLEWTRGQGACETPLQVCDQDEYVTLNEEDTSPHVCFKPMEKGRCSGNVTRFYFNSEAQDCKQFEYSGCESNGNNFETEESCRAACGGVSQTDRNNKQRAIRYIFGRNDGSGHCSLAAEVGWCFGRHERFFFDSFTGRCTSFQYTGCGGNANNFASELECERRCENDRFFNSIEENNKLETKLNEEDPSTFCHQAPEQGPCSEWKMRFAFNASSGQCDIFFYGGCEGNKNNFRRQPECANTCSKYTALKVRQQPIKERKVFACDQPEDAGDCFGQNQRWRYDSGLQTCVAFSYTGCGGNENRFDTFYSCIDACTGYRNVLAQAEQLDILRSGLLDDPAAIGLKPVINERRTVDCLQTPKVGPCKKTFTRWYFDPTTGSCATFEYGGCDGNDNNFASRRECEQSCIDEDSQADTSYNDDNNNDDQSTNAVCTEPMQPGPCRGRYMKYWFNKVTQQCESFIYGGCGKNNNHFDTQDECREVCERSGRSRRSQFHQTTPSFCSERSDYGKVNCEKDDASKWFYNSEHGRCEQFTYSGCGGNLNNFATWRECHNVCEEGYQVANGRPAAAEFDDSDVFTDS